MQHLLTGARPGLLFNITFASLVYTRLCSPGALAKRVSSDSVFTGNLGLQYNDFGTKK